VNTALTLGFLSSVVYLTFFFFKIQRTSFTDILRLISHSGKYLKKLLAYGMPLYLSGIAGMLTLNIDKILVSKLAGLEQFAVYSVGAIEIPLFSLLVSSITQPLFPKYVELINNNQIEEAKQLWIRITKKISYLTYPIIIVLMLLSKKLILLLYGTKYQDAYIIFSTYLLVAIFRNNYYGIILSAKGQTNWLLFYSILTAIFNLLFSYIFYMNLGIIGVIWGTWISVLIIAILQLVHEGLFKAYITEFLLNSRILFLLFGIFVSYYLVVHLR
jgi:O-antigen/teichoic acid export membrane protein